MARVSGSTASSSAARSPPSSAPSAHTEPRVSPTWRGTSCASTSKEWLVLPPPSRVEQCKQWYCCTDCGKRYKHQPSLWKHRKYECGKEPQFQCPLCPHRSKRKQHLTIHMQALHGVSPSC